jgi:membrane protein implicated in regulation of membrane protease activity
MTILTAPETWPFGAALAVMVGLSIIEGAGLLLAYSPSQLIDGLLPDMPDGADGVLGWLHVGKVPILVLLILFLSGFAIAGYVLQASAQSLGGLLLPAWLACLPACLAGVSTVKGVGSVLAKVMPQDESSAVSEQSLIGRPGVVIQGIARDGMAAQAKVRDSHGRAHYVMVEPDLSEETFAEGSDILLVKKIGARFKCIRNPHPTLLS